MSRTRFVLRIIIIAGCAILGAAAGICFQALRITGKPQEFRSLAKLVAAGSMQPPTGSGQDPPSVQLADFYGTVIETVVSSDMKRRALERVRALHPEFKECDVQIRAVRTKGSGIFNVMAVGGEPRYTKIFLDALLDEFMAFRQAIGDQGQGRSIQSFLKGVVDQQKSMEELQGAVEKARSKAESLPAKAEQERVVARLSSFRNQRDDLRLELRALAVGEASRAALEAKALIVDHEIQALEAATNAFEQAAAEFRTASEKHAQAKLAYEKMFNAVQEFQSAFNSTQGDYVAIQERASAAAENVEDWVLPLAVGGGVGGLLGFLAGFMISLALSGPAGPAPVPVKEK